jgi:hypothetical protein
MAGNFRRSELRPDTGHARLWWGSAPTGSYDAFLEWAGKAHELGLNEVVIHWPIPDSDYDCDTVTFERIITDGVAEVARWK